MNRSQVIGLTLLAIALVMHFSRDLLISLGVF